ncbi:hypothetical protein, partial [Pseudomonas sp. MWU12-2115]|uniref:hypothetical protein n=1 Tax=Pseudomonas sp. MWU12-2115 TaxID=2071713 RepID=UPI001C499FE7
FYSGRVVLERYGLVEVGAVVGHALYVNSDPEGGAFNVGRGLGDVDGFQCCRGAGDGGRAVGGLEQPAAKTDVEERGAFGAIRISGLVIEAMVAAHDGEQPALRLARPGAGQLDEEAEYLDIFTSRFPPFSLAVCFV